MDPSPQQRKTRRRRIIATVSALTVIGIAGGYGTYSAFTDTTELDGTASAGTIQLNDKGADARTVSVSGLLPGDAPSICFVVAAPAAGNSQSQSVSLAATNTTTATTANTSLAGDVQVTLSRVAASNEDYTTLDGPAGGTIAMSRTGSCTSVPTPDATVGPLSVTGIGGLTDSFTLAPGNKEIYKLTVSLPTTAAAASQGGTANFKLLWTGSVGS